VNEIGDNGRNLGGGRRLAGDTSVKPLDVFWQLKIDVLREILVLFAVL
jgi:hypothetical protein